MSYLNDILASKTYLGIRATNSWVYAPNKLCMHLLEAPSDQPDK